MDFNQPIYGSGSIYISSPFIAGIRDGKTKEEHFTT